VYYVIQSMSIVI